MRNLLFILPLAGLLWACDDFRTDDGETRLQWSFDKETELLTRSLSEIPDTNDFLLTISDAGGKVLYNGPYGHSPASLAVEAGSYILDVVSEEFTAPAFARPQYGDTRVVVVKSGQKARADLRCTLLNAGVRLRIGTEFLSSHPRGTLFLKSAEGKLMYGFSEKRIAYFKPGSISLILSEDGTDRPLLTRTLAAQEVLTLHISAPAEGAVGAGGLTISVDTTKTWKDESFTIDGPQEGGGTGSGDSGADISHALSVQQAKSSVGEDNVWVYGYIVGGDLTATGSRMNTGPVFTKNSHLAIATRSSVTDKSACLSVELKAGAVRDGLNLVDHPDLVGSRVYLKGSIVEAYFGIPGIKNVTEYVLR